MMDTLKDVYGDMVLSDLDLEQLYQELDQTNQGKVSKQDLANFIKDIANMWTSMKSWVTAVYT